MPQPCFSAPQGHFATVSAANTALEQGATVVSPLCLQCLVPGAQQGGCNVVLTLQLLLRVYRGAVPICGKTWFLHLDPCTCASYLAGAIPVRYAPPL